MSSIFERFKHQHRGSTSFDRKPFGRQTFGRQIFGCQTVSQHKVWPVQHDPVIWSTVNSSKSLFMINVCRSLVCRANVFRPGDAEPHSTQMLSRYDFSISASQVGNTINLEIF